MKSGNSFADIITKRPSGKSSKRGMKKSSKRGGRK